MILFLTLYKSTQSDLVLNLNSSIPSSEPKPSLPQVY